MRYVVVGNGITGVTAAQTLRERDDAAEIILIGEETDYFYSRTALMWIYMKQLGRRDVEPYERWHWEQQRLELVRDRVTAIDVSGRKLTLERGKRLPYDRLLLATGAQPNKFGWPGQDLDGICTMVSMSDVDRLEAVRQRLQRAVVVGGGLIGIELVEMMLHEHRPVTYLVREPWYWNLVLSKEEAEIVHEQLRDAGVNLILEDETAEMVAGADGRVRELVTKKGQRLPCELVGIAVGVHANIELARQAGLKVERGVMVDEALRTSAPDIWAAGDCAEIVRPARNAVEQLWYTGLLQGQAAGRAMAGDEVHYDRGVPYNSAQYLFLDYCAVGWMRNVPFDVPAARLPAEHRDGSNRRLPAELPLEEWFHRAPGARDSIRIVHFAGGGPVLGFSMLGSRWRAATLIRWIEERRSLKWVLAHLADAVFNEEFRKDRFAGVVHA